MKEEIYYFKQFYDKDAPINIHMIGKSYCDKDYIIVRQNSDICSIEYTIKGIGELKTEGEKFVIEKNDTYFLHKNKYHEYYSTSDNWEKIWIVYEGKLIEELFASYLNGKIHCIKNFNIGGYLKEIFELAEKKAPYREIVNLAAISTHKILLKAKESLSTPILSFPEQVKHYIDENITQSFSLSNLCDEFNYSKNHVINVFKDCYHITPQVYFSQKRLTLVKDYLKNTNLSIEAISLDLNFGSANYLTSFFKSRCGITPTQFRKVL